MLQNFCAFYGGLRRARNKWLFEHQNQAPEELVSFYKQQSGEYLQMTEEGTRK